jgi:hypothetical protein
MLDAITKANEKYFVNIIQHGSDELTCKPRIKCSKVSLFPHMKISIKVTIM